jgi:hypothetical protein
MYSVKYTNDYLDYLGGGIGKPLHLQIFKSVSCTIPMFAARRSLALPSYLLQLFCNKFVKPSVSNLVKDNMWL